jgi:hypothetical protein
MSGLFSKKKQGDPDLSFVDLDGLPLQEGDTVMSLRYELGKCKVIKTETGMAYESIDNGQIVNWARMIDASTRNQKVRKIT